MFELSQLRCFVAVATELNFRRAAERLNMTQPPLSRQIQLLEHQLNIRLFERTKRSVRLTSAGRMFLPEAQSLLDRAHVVALAAQRVARGDAGSVAVGFVAGAIYDFLPRVVSAARMQLPDIDLFLKEMNNYELIEGLASRQIDLGLVRPPLDRRGIESECVVRESFVLAIPRDHPLAAKRRLTIAGLDKQPFIMYSPTHWRPFYELLAGMFRSAAIAPEYVQFIGSTHSIVALVNTGMGIALVPKAAAKLQFDNVLFRPINLGAGIQAELHLVWRKDNENSAFPALRDLILRSSRKS
jgi:DNA-binding transcriptional LysR family regulator